MSIDQNSAFAIELMKQLATAPYNLYGQENWDPDRFGSARPSRAHRTAAALNKVLAGLGLCLVPRRGERVRERIESIGNLLGGLEWLYELLDDEASKALLVKLIAYRILGPAKVKLPTNTPEYWQARSQVLGLARDEDVVQLGFKNWPLHRFQLDDIGFPGSVYSTAYGVLRTFVLKQYEYRACTPAVKAQRGDWVIDAGGCWGDTALYFAQEVGESGRVFSFEFVPSNLKVLYRNLGLNPALSQRVTVVERPLWETSETILFYCDSGPGTRVGREPISPDDVALRTQSIDDYCRQHAVAKVDLIKMDIEGAELEALRGASETILQHRPALALSVYHRLSDLVEIPRFLLTLSCPYRFTLGHYSIHQEETVLFAAPI